MIENSDKDIYIGKDGRSSFTRFSIKDPEVIMQRIIAAYRKSGEELTPEVEALIRSYISSNETFAIIDGIPGLHAEVRVLNFFQRMANANKADLDLGGLAIATVHTQTGDAFPACNNCTGIIPERVDVYTRTMRNP